MQDVFPSSFFPSPLHEAEKQKKKKHRYSWLGLALFFAGAFFIQQNPQLLLTDLLQFSQHAPFDGTAFPIQKSPDWVHLSSTEYKLSYDQIPPEKMQQFPVYDPSKLSMSTEGFEWNNPSHNAIRNAKITYSVPYMGSYRLNGKENDGSHLAVDIKVPENTPVYAIANGVVNKVSNITSGFGKHVVIQHNDVPTLESASVRETLYSGYNHLSSIVVTERQIVKKGDLIAYSGSTGFATTPHLHFQIDKDDAPWHPYWPFTFKESRDTGLDFIGAVNAGLGKDKALLMTISPLAYVQKYLNFQGSSGFSEVSNPPVSDSSLDSSSTSYVSGTSQPAAEDVPSAKPLNGFEFSHPASFQTSDSVNIQIFAKDRDGSNLTAFDGEGILLLTGNVGVLPKASLSSADFVGGSYTVILQDVKAGTGQLIILYQGKQFSSQSFTISATSPTPVPVPVSGVVSDAATDATTEPVSEPVASSSEIVPPVVPTVPVVPIVPAEDPPPLTPEPSSFDGSYDEEISAYDIRLIGAIAVDNPVTVVVRALNHSNTLIPNFVPSVSLNIELLKGRAELSKLVLLPEDFANGEAVFSLTPKDSSAISLKISNGSLSTVNHVYKDQLFADVDGLHPYYDAIRYLKLKEVLSGYPDGTFQPDKKVSRVEALKIILKGTNGNFVTLDNPPKFKDVRYPLWYGPYVMTAYQRNIARGYDDNTFRPSQKVIRAEFLKMLLQAMLTPLSPVASEKPFEDVPVDAWFAPYVAYAKEKNLLPKNTTEFRPAEEMSRDEVAEILYRLLVVRETQATAYAPNLIQ